MWPCLIALNLEVHTGNILGMLPSSVAPCIFIDSCDWDVFKARLEGSFFFAVQRLKYVAIFFVVYYLAAKIAFNIFCRLQSLLPNPWMDYSFWRWPQFICISLFDAVRHTTWVPYFCCCATAQLWFMIRKSVVPQKHIRFWKTHGTMLNYCLKVRVHGSAWSSKIWLAHNMMELMCQETWKLWCWLSNIESRVQVLFCLMWCVYMYNNVCVGLCN